MAHHQNEMEYNCQQQSDKLIIYKKLSFALTIWCERYLGKYHQEIYKIYEDTKHLNNSEKIYILTKPRWLSRWRTYSRMDVSKIYRRT